MRSSSSSFCPSASPRGTSWYQSSMLWFQWLWCGWTRHGFGSLMWCFVFAPGVLLGFLCSQRFCVHDLYAWLLDWYGWVAMNCYWQVSLLDLPWQGANLMRYLSVCTIWFATWHILPRMCHWATCRAGGSAPSFDKRLWEADWARGFGKSFSGQWWSSPFWRNPQISGVFMVISGYLVEMETP